MMEINIEKIQTEIEENLLVIFNSSDIFKKRELYLKNIVLLDKYIKFLERSNKEPNLLSDLRLTKKEYLKKEIDLKFKCEINKLESIDVDLIKEYLVNQQKMRKIGKYKEVGIKKTNDFKIISTEFLDFLKIFVPIFKKNVDIISGELIEKS